MSLASTGSVGLPGGPVGPVLSQATGTNTNPLLWTSQLDVLQVGGLPVCPGQLRTPWAPLRSRPCCSSLLWTSRLDVMQGGGGGGLRLAAPPNP